MPTGARRVLRGLLVALAVAGSAGTTLASDDIDAWQCLRVRDPGGKPPEESGAADPTGVSTLEAPGLPSGCHLRRRASLLCSSAGLEGVAPSRTDDGDVHDHLCYRVECASDDEQATPSWMRETRALLADAFGARVVEHRGASFVCTPADLAFPAGATASGSGGGTTGSDGATSPSTASAFAPALCGDFSGNGIIQASDALGALRSAIGSATCLPCVCDTDRGGTTTAADALRILRRAVGQSVTLDCQEDGTPVAWTGGGDGVSWHDAANWSTATRVPNLCEAVAIDAPGLTVTHTQGEHGVHSVTSSASISLQAGTLRVRDTAAVSGTFLVRGGTLKDATVVAPVAATTPRSPRVLVGSGFGGTVEAVTIQDSFDLTGSSAQVNVRGGLTVDGTVSMGQGSQLRFTQTAGQVLDGDGEIVFGSVGAKSLAVDPGISLTIASGVTVRGATGNVGTFGPLDIEGTVDSDEPGLITVVATSPWTNHGVLRARDGGDLRLDGEWTNEGTIGVEDGGDLTLDGNWTNLATITADESDVFLDGEFSFADLGSFERTGGSVNLTGTLDNAAGLTLDATTGSWNLRGGIVDGGTVATDAGSAFVATPFGGRLRGGVVLEDGMDLTQSSASVAVEGGLTLDGTIAMGQGSQLRFLQTATQSLVGSGEIVFGATGSKTIGVDPGVALTIGEDIVIRGGTGSVGNFGALDILGTVDSDEPGLVTVVATSPWTNHGTLKARGGGDLKLDGAWTNEGAISVEDGGDLTLDGNWTNTGTVTAVDSDVFLDGEFALADIGSFSRTGGNVNVTGVFDNSAGLALDATTGSWNLRGGTIAGGSVSAADGAALVATPFGGRLEGVSLSSGLDMGASSASVNVTGGLTLDGSIPMGQGAGIRFLGAGPQTLDGSGEILFGSTGNKSVTIDPGTELTIASGITVRGGLGTLGSLGALTIDGVVEVDAPGTLTIASSTGWTNRGTIRVREGDLSFGAVGSNEGSIELGPGRTMTAPSGFTQQATGVLRVVLAGPGDFGKATISGQASLAGTFEVEVDPGYDPAIGTTFTVLTFGSRTGDFALVDGLDLGGGKTFTRSFTAGAMVLEVVSE